MKPKNKPTVERPPLLRQMASELSLECVRSVEHAGWCLTVLSRLCPDLEPVTGRAGEILVGAQSWARRLEVLVHQVQEGMELSAPIDEPTVDEALQVLVEVERWEYQARFSVSPDRPTRTFSRSAGDD